MKPSEKYDYELSLAMDFEDDLITEEEFYEKMNQFYKNEVDIEYYQWLIDNICKNDERQKNIYLKKIQELKNI